MEEYILENQFYLGERTSELGLKQEKIKNPRQREEHVKSLGGEKELRVSEDQGDVWLSLEQRT